MGDRIIAHPGDSALEDVKVDPVTATKEDQ